MGRFIFVSFGLLVLFLSLSGTGAGLHCPSDWYYYDQHCYRIFNEEMNWEDAEWFCTKQAKGAHLVSIKSAKEADFVAWMVTQNIEESFSHVSIGLRVQNKEKQCSTKWSDGSSVSYDNLLDLYITKCSLLKKETGFRKWFVASCIGKIPFVCKFPPQC
uniref:Snaclec convulxin subunit alpha n=2 Tax=Crotalus durissus terrificus TaxID=8732 RepID=SLA_CRODU|nr:RecName: Full=Snaclec convulxin subunit alpha; Short=CVX-alpha; Flags: Precursor [Crotalus durissus terrificus]AAQ11363.1 convulxin subunit a [Crotalus durissus terrificus]CAA76181.1 convulxin alpha [Crotalus durissus terrificus]